MIYIPQRIRLLISLITLQLISISVLYAEPISHQKLTSLLQQLSTTIEENYVESNIAKEISDTLQAASQQSHIRNADSPEALAGLLTELLQAFDTHFSITWSTPANAPSHNDVSDADRQARREQQLAALRRQNYGFRELRILPGNIGYLNLNQFSDANSPQAAQAAIAAMNFLAGSDTIIIDLRQNGGGAPNMVQLLSSYLFAESTYLNALYYRPSDETRQFWTHDQVSGERFPDTPVYVLISARTGSAAEEFAYNLQTRERATLVGETTAGGANPGGVFPIADGFSAFISTGKAINPITQTNWEKVGVKPEINVAANDALNWAIDDALTQLSKNTNDELQDREISWAQEARQAQKTLTNNEINEIIGLYGSDRNIQLINGELTYLRGRRPAQRMYALSQDRFMLNGVDGFRITVERDEDSQIKTITENWVWGLSRPWPKQ